MHISLIFLLLVIWMLPTQTFATESNGNEVNTQSSEVSTDSEKKPMGSSSSSMQNLASQANNPTIPLSVLQLRNVTAFDTPGLNGASNVAELTAVLPIKPFGFIKVPTITKITVPYVTVPDPIGQSAFGNFQIFSQAVFNKKWGSFALGATVAIPSTVAKREGVTWQAGPAAGFMYTGVKQLIVGGIFQNPISINPGPNDIKSNSLVIAPTLTYNLSSGWFAGLSDYNWSFDWENDGAATIPLGLQVGRVFKIDKQAVSLSFEAGYTVIKPDDSLTPNYLIGLELGFIFPDTL